MKKNVTIIAIILIFMIATISNAKTLTLNLSADNSKVKEGQNVKVKVDWQEGMQAADFYLNYDSNMLLFVNTDVLSNYYNVNSDNNGEGKIEVSWYSIDDTDKTSMEFEFQALNAGKTTVSTQIAAGFADGNLVEPDDYQDGSIEINIKSKKNKLVIIIGIIALAIIVITVIVLKKKDR